MKVLFPPEAGNEFQEKTVSVAFEFTATAEPAPTAGPTSTPQPTDTPTAAVTPMPTSTPGSTSSPGSTPPAATTVPTASPAGSASPGSSAAPSQAPATATAAPDGVSVSEEPVPLGAGEEDGGNRPSATWISEPLHLAAHQPLHQGRRSTSLMTRFRWAGRRKTADCPTQPALGTI